MDCLDLMVRSVCVHQLLGPHTRHWIFPVRFDVTKDLPQHKPTECRKAVKRIEAAWDVVADGGVVREGAAEPQQHCKEQVNACINDFPFFLAWCLQVVSRQIRNSLKSNAMKKEEEKNFSRPQTYLYTTHLGH